MLDEELKNAMLEDVLKDLENDAKNRKEMEELDAHIEEELQDTANDSSLEEVVDTQVSEEENAQLQDHEILLTEEAGIPMLIYRALSTDHDEQLTKIPLLTVDGTALLPRAMHLIEYSNNLSKALEKDTIICELTNPDLVDVINRYAGTELEVFSPVEQGKARTRTHTIMGVEALQGTNNILVTEGYGRAEILYYDENGRGLHSISLKGEDGSYSQEAMEFIKNAHDRVGQSVLFGRLSPSLSESLANYTGIVVEPTDPERQISSGDSSSEEDTTVSSLEEDRSDDSISRDDSLPSQSKLHISGTFLANELVSPSIFVTNEDGTDTFVPLYDGDEGDFYNQEALDVIRTTLRNENMSFDEAIANHVITWENQEDIHNIVKDLIYIHSIGNGVASMEVADDYLLVRYEDGYEGQLPILDQYGENDFNTEVYLFDVLRNKGLTYQEAVESGFLVDPTFVDESTNEVTITPSGDHPIAKIVMYDFRESFNPIVPNIASTENGLMPLNNNVRTLTQACVFYQDGSFKNILVEQKEKQLTGNTNSYRFEDDLVHLIGEFAGEEITLQEAIARGLVEKVSGYEFEENFATYMKEASVKRQLPMVVKESQGTSHSSHLPPKPPVPPMPPVPPKKKPGFMKRLLNSVKEKVGSFVHNIKSSVANIKSTIGNWKLSRNSITGKIKDFGSKKLFSLRQKNIKGTIKEKVLPFMVAHPKIVGLAVATGVTGLVFATSYNPIPKDTEQNTSKEADIDHDSESQVDYSDLLIEDALEAIPEGFNKDVQKANWEYINYYNDQLASRHLQEGKESRLAVTYDNVKAEYFGYNADFLSQDKMNLLIGNYKVSSEFLKTNFAEAHGEDMLAYVVSGEEVDKSSLFMTEDGAYFHHKYASLVADMVSAESRNQKVIAAAKFRQFAAEEVRMMNQDFAQNGKTDSYKLSLAPIVEAAEFICQRDQLEPILSEDASKAFKDGVMKQANAYYDDMTKNLGAYQEMTDTLGEGKNASNYEVFKVKTENNLNGRGIYNIASRDIRDHEEFVVAPPKEETQAVETQTVSTSNESTPVVEEATVYNESLTSSIREAIVEVVGGETIDLSQISNGETVDEVDSSYDSSTDTEVEEVPDLGEDDSMDSEIDDTLEDDFVYEENDEQNRIDAETKSEQIEQDYEKDENTSKDQLQTEVDESDESYQESLDQSGTTVTEENLGSDTIFNDENKNENGALDTSVSDLTTDGSGVDNGELPDPGSVEGTGDYVDDGAYDIVESEVSYDAIASDIVASMENEAVWVDSSVDTHTK